MECVCEDTKTCNSGCFQGGKLEAGQKYEGSNFRNFEFVPYAYYLLQYETQKQFMKIENILQDTNDISWASLVAQLVKNSTAMQETSV